MNRMFKKLIITEYRRLVTLILIFVISLVLSALIFVLSGQESTIGINYESISKLPLLTLFLRMLKRNMAYFVAIICLTCIGQGKMIKGLFSLISIYYGLSVIYLIKIIQTDKLYFVFTFVDYFVFFPLLFYFTYISIIISKYTKKAKNIETISNKLDILISSYIKISLIYLAVVAVYSLGYSYYIIILSRLLVK